MKHRNELSQTEKNLLESLASQSSLGSLPDEENDGANLEYDRPHCNQDRQKTPVKRHSIETSASADTSTQQVRNSNCEHNHFKSVDSMPRNMKSLIHHCFSSRTTGPVDELYANKGLE